MIGSSPRLRGTAHARGRPASQIRFIPAPAGNGSPPAMSAPCTAVHPRACGERAEGRLLGYVCRGSSPRLRGTGGFPGSEPLPNRFIPAPAGNGPCATSAASTSAVHPRACGERRWVLMRRVRWSGSSPRLRGTAHNVKLLVRVVRFIPAPAGNGQISSRIARVVDGSSPRLRGTAQRGGGISPGQRFIPAPAGNGSTTQPRRGPSAVHPRACGERPSSSRSSTTRSGSSPRLRGTARAGEPSAPERRFIPAPAGNGPLASIRGNRITGSSPRLRGTVEVGLADGDEGRFIPAPAGNGPQAGQSMCPSTVHPRACGERDWRESLSQVAAGSSPRLRGTGESHNRARPRRRFIPAPAGNGFPGRCGNPTIPVHPRACGERTGSGRRTR